MTIHRPSLIALFLLSLPLTGQLKAQAVVHVSSYGAIPDDGVDDILAIRAAIAALPTSGSILRFDPGTYDIKPLTTLGAPAGLGGPGGNDPIATVIFPISGKSGLTIEGNGAILLCHEFDETRGFFVNYYDLFGIANSSFVTVQDLTVNMSRLPFSIGTCTGVTYIPTNLRLNRILVVMNPGFRNLPNALGMRIHAMTSRRGGAPAGQIFYNLQQWTPAPPVPPADFSVAWQNGGTILRIQGNWPITLPPLRSLSSYPGYVMSSNLPGGSIPDPLAQGRLKVGDEVIFAHAYRFYNAFDFQNCSNSLVSNLTVYSWPGKALRMLQDQDTVIDGLQVLPDPQLGYGVSTTGEAMVLRNCRGSLQVVDCKLEGMLHDGVNVYTDLLRKAPAQPGAPTTIDVENAIQGRFFQSGHVFEFYDASMIPLGTGSLSATSTNILPPPLPALHRLVFTSLPVPKTSIAYVCSLDESPFTDVSGLEVSNNFGVGLLVRRDANVLNGLFDHVSGSALEIGPSILIHQLGTFPAGQIPALGSHLTGPGGKNVLVDFSEFSFCNRGAGLRPYSEGTINIQTAIYTEATTTVVTRTSGIFGSVTGVTLRQLNMSGSGGATIAMRSANAVTIEDSSFGPCGDLGFLLPANLPFGAGRFAGDSLIFSHNAGDVLIQGNSASGFLNPDRTWAPMYGFYSKMGNSGF